MVCVKEGVYTELARIGSRRQVVAVVVKPAPSSSSIVAGRVYVIQTG